MQRILFPFLNFILLGLLFCGQVKAAAVTWTLNNVTFRTEEFGDHQHYYGGTATGWFTLDGNTALA